MPDSGTGIGRCAAAGRVRVDVVDRHVGARVRDRRLALGVSQQELADRLGITYQQLHKYEHGTNRIAAGRLPAIARALGVGVGHLFEGLGDGDDPGTAGTAPPRRRVLLGLARDFADIPDPGHREALCRLANALADGDREPAAAATG